MRNAGGRSIKAYALSAVLAGGFSLAASFGLGALLTLDTRAALGLLLERWWPWSFSAAAAAFVLAYLADNRARASLRWVEAATQGALGAIAASGVWLLLRSLCQGGEPECLPRLVGVVASNAICGAVIGFCAPSWYRMPQTMRVEYHKWKVTIATHTVDAGRVAATVEMIPPAPSRSAPVTLAYGDEYPAAEDAIAASMAQARDRIDRFDRADPDAEKT